MLILDPQYFKNVCSWLVVTTLSIAILPLSASSILAQSSILENDAELARAQCLEELQLDCLVTLIWNIPIEDPRLEVLEGDGAGGKLKMLIQLGYTEEAETFATTLPETPTSLMLFDNFDSAVALHEENSKTAIYEQWSAKDEAIIMVARELLRRGDLDAAIEVAITSEGVWGSSDSYLARLLDDSLRQENSDAATQVAMAMSNQNAFGFYEEQSGPRDRANYKIVTYLVDRGRLEEAHDIAVRIVGYPEKCDADVRLAHAYFANGKSEIAASTLKAIIDTLPEMQWRSSLISNCLLSIAGRQLEFGDIASVQQTIDIADVMLNLMRKPGGPGIVPNALVVQHSKLAALQARLGREIDAQQSFEIASSHFDTIDRPHASFPAELWLAYARALIDAAPDRALDLSDLRQNVSQKITERRVGEGPIGKFVEDIAAEGDWETARQIFEQVAQIDGQDSAAFRLREAILSQMMLRGHVELAIDLIAVDESQFERYQTEQGQRWVARAAFAKGDIELARQILRDQMASNPVEPTILIGLQQMLGFDEDVRESYRQYFRQVLDYPPDFRRNELYFIAEGLK